MASNNFYTFFKICLNKRAIRDLKEFSELGDLVAIDGSLIDSVLSMVWADYRKGAKKAKVHIGFNINCSIPQKIFLTEGNGGGGRLTSALNHLVQKLQKNSVNIHSLRDATRGGAGGVLAELAEQSRTHLQIEEKSLPVKEEVRGFAEIYGLEPLFLANEGKMLLFCPADEAKKVLEIMQDDPLGKNAAIIGRVRDENQPTGRVTMKTLIGGERIIDQPSGDLVPRIC